MGPSNNSTKKQQQTSSGPGPAPATSNSTSNSTKKGGNGGGFDFSKFINNKKPPPVDKLLVPAIVLAIAVLSYQFFRGISSEIKRVDTDDELEVREIFFGGMEDGSSKSFVVLCHDESSKAPISSVFNDAYKDGSVPAEFRIIDCNHILPDSGKTIYERFNFDNKVRPTIFISGAKIDGEPQQVPVKHLKTGKMLVKVLKNKLEPRAAKIETTQELRTKCLDKPICALLLKGSKKAPGYLKDAMSKVLVEFPKVAFGSVDSSVLYVYNLEEYIPELANDQPRFVVFKKVSGSLDPKGERLITSMASFEANGVSYGQMSNLLASVVSNQATLKKLPVLPTIKTRTKKLESDERAKRERKNRPQQQQQQQQQKPSQSGSGSFDNDGSIDGRRAERERRRAEHAKLHNVKPKTPEEIAEMERQRRIRMEQEALKWNMAPEDIPPEGDPINSQNDIDGENENNNMYMSDDEIDSEHYDSDGSGAIVSEESIEDGGEDVIDLD